MKGDAYRVGYRKSRTFREWDQVGAIREFQTCTFLMLGNSENGKVGSSELLPSEQGPLPHSEPNFSASFSLEKMDLWDGAVDCVINSCKIRTNITI